MLLKEPVIHNGIEYKCISAIIHRMSEKGIVIQAELAEKYTHSVTIARPDKIERKK
jgi:hypothetical protein